VLFRLGARPHRSRSGGNTHTLIGGRSSFAGLGSSPLAALVIALIIQGGPLLFARLVMLLLLWARHELVGFTSDGFNVRPELAILLGRPIFH